MSIFREVITTANELSAILEAAARRYTYEEVEMKRWVTDGGACPLCEENEDLGWVDMDDVFEGVFGFVDDAPAHPHCGCDVEQATRRRRVYS
jgi:hypothetical protein